jgi:hypothetical protein
VIEFNLEGRSGIIVPPDSPASARIVIVFCRAVGLRQSHVFDVVLSTL